MSEPEVSEPFERDELVPFMPHNVEGTGIDFGFLADLALKVVYSDSQSTTERVAEKLKLSMAVTETLLQYLYREKFVDIRGPAGFRNDRYAMLDHGWERVRRLLEVSGYIGPAPVTLSSYTGMVQWQEKVKESIDSESIRAALGHLVLPDSVIQTLGLVANSRRSLFITGSPGNGKTSIARAIHSALGGEVWIPYAVEVDGQIIKIFDAHNHEPVNRQPSVRHDERWVRIKRPLVVVGGEVTMDSTDLIYSHSVRYYEAPFHMKSNAGTLVIDDFGRQRVEPRDLINRWIIPLESRTDYLTLHTGKKIQVPFEQLLIFATNLNPSSLVDDAFLRRIGYRLRVYAPSEETYGLIFRRYVESRGFKYDQTLVDMLLNLYRREQRPMSCCEPRDLIERSLDICRYQGNPPTITPELLEIAWANYFGRQRG